jgi:D-glycero-D-manno-heptose 1,7-bisphosphate phosphatase
MRRAVFLDRDGVLNRSRLVDGVPTPPCSIGEVEILAGVIEGIKILKEHLLVPVVVTNQPDTARGLSTQSQVHSINHYIGSVTDIEYFYTCFHDDADNCDCRKPSIGLLKRAAKDLDLDIQNSFMVGDRWRDISAGQAAGCKSFFIDYSYPEKQPEMPFTKVSSLLEAVGIVIGESCGDHA